VKLAASIVRVAIEVAGVFLVLATTAEQFDATEIAALFGIAAILVTVEACVAFSMWKAPRAPMIAGVALAASLIGLGWIGCASQPRFRIRTEMIALIEGLRR
jgi:hypothetical protein